MDQAQTIAGIAAGIAGAIASLASIFAVVRNGTPGSTRRAFGLGVASTLAGVLAAAVVLGLLFQLGVGIFQERDVDITAGGGSTGCIDDVAGTATVPENEDAWVILKNEQGNFWVQNDGQPVLSGGEKGDWELPGVIISDKFYKDAYYQLISVVIPVEESARIQRAFTELERKKMTDKSLPPDKYPSTVLKQSTVGVRLTSRLGCR